MEYIIENKTTCTKNLKLLKTEQLFVLRINIRRWYFEGVVNSHDLYFTEEYYN